MTEELQFQTLVDYYRNNKVENISLLTKLGIEEDIAFSYEWFIHKYMRQETKESLNFATYTCLIQAKPEYYGNYVDYMIEKVGIPEEVLETCLTYIRSGLIPYKLWVDKLISDVNNTEYYSHNSVPGMLLVYLNIVMRTSIIGYLKAHKALCETELSPEIQSVVDLAYTMYMGLPKALKNDYMKLFKSEKENDRRKLSDYELSLFGCTLIDMSSCPISLDLIKAIEDGKIPANSKFWEEPMTGVPCERIINRSRVQILEADEEVPVSDMKELHIESENNDEVVEPTEFIVEKVAKNGSNRVMSRNKFETREAAENFIEDVLSAVPSITDSFMFTINSVPYVGKSVI